jgi:hypothetical protein
MYTHTFNGSISLTASLLLVMIELEKEVKNFTFIEKFLSPSVTAAVS